MDKPEKIKLTCPECGAGLRALRELVGRRAKCKACGTKVLVTLPADDAGDQPPPTEHVETAIPVESPEPEMLSLDDADALPPSPFRNPVPYRTAKNPATRGRPTAPRPDDDEDEPADSESYTRLWAWVAGGGLVAVTVIGLLVFALSGSKKKPEPEAAPDVAKGVNNPTAPKGPTEAEKAIAKLKEEEDAIAKDRADALAAKTAEADRIAKKQEEDLLAAKKAEADLIAKKKEKDDLAAKKAEDDVIAKKREAEKLKIDNEKRTQDRYWAFTAGFTGCTLGMVWDDAKGGDPTILAAVQKAHEKLGLSTDVFTRLRRPGGANQKEAEKILGVDVITPLEKALGDDVANCFLAGNIFARVWATMEAKERNPKLDVPKDNVVLSFTLMIATAKRAQLPQEFIAGMDGVQKKLEGSFTAITIRESNKTLRSWTTNLLSADQSVKHFQLPIDTKPKPATPTKPNDTPSDPGPPKEMANQDAKLEGKILHYTPNIPDVKLKDNERLCLYVFVSPVGKTLDQDIIKSATSGTVGGRSPLTGLQIFESKLLDARTGVMAGTLYRAHDPQKEVLADKKLVKVDVGTTDAKTTISVAVGVFDSKNGDYPFLRFVTPVTSVKGAGK